MADQTQRPVHVDEGHSTWVKVGNEICVHHVMLFQSEQAWEVLTILWEIIQGRFLLHKV